MTSTTMPGGTITAFQTNDASFTTLKNAITQVHSDVVQLGKGYCAENHAQQCTPADSCTCQGIGTQR